MNTFFLQNTFAKVYIFFKNIFIKIRIKEILSKSCHCSRRKYIANPYHPDGNAYVLNVLNTDVNST
jgi:hypothetical protein